jgi:hypothetical protein
MMELKRADPPVIAADAAPPAGLPDKNLLQLAPPPRHGLGPTSEATVNASGLEPELRKTVTGALHDLAIGMDASDALSVLAPGAVRAQVVLSEPVPHRGLAETEPLCDLASRETFGDETRQRVAIDPSLWRVPVAMDGRKAVLLDPITDRRGIASSELANTLKRKPPAEVGLKHRCVHSPNTSSGIGRNG